MPQANQNQTKKTFSAHLASGRKSLVYFVQGVYNGKDVWHYVLVDKNKLPLFLGKLKTGALDVANYGKILYSGWGKKAPQYILEEIEESFKH